MKTYDELLAENIGLLKLEVQRFLDRFSDPRLEFEDALQEARVILWRCMSKFDPDRGTKFSTYLGGALRRSLADFARRTLPKIRVGPNSNSWRKVSVVSWDALSVDAQERALQGYTIDIEEAA